MSESVHPFNRMHRLEILFWLLIETVQSQNGATCTWVAPSGDHFDGTCLPVGSPQIEDQYVCHGFYMTNICSDQTVISRLISLIIKDFMLY